MDCFGWLCPRHVCKKQWWDTCQTLPFFFGWPSKKSHPKVIRVWVFPYWSAAASVWAPKCNANSVPRWHVLVDHFLRRFRIFIFKSKLHIFKKVWAQQSGALEKLRSWVHGDDIQSVFSTPKVECCYTMLLRERVQKFKTSSSSTSGNLKVKSKYMDTGPDLRNWTCRRGRAMDFCCRSAAQSDQVGSKLQGSNWW